jgi:hypothetical protein
MTTLEALAAVKNLRAAAGALPTALTRLTEAVASAQAVKYGEAIQALAQLDALVEHADAVQAEIKFYETKLKAMKSKELDACMDWIRFLMTVAKFENDDEAVLGPRQREALAEARSKLAAVEGK